MLLLSILIAFVVIILVKLYKNVTQLPPGPWGLPLLGYYPFLGSKPIQTFAHLANKYGDIMTVNILGKNYYYLNGLKVVKEVLVKQTNFTSERPVHYEKHSTFALVLGSRTLFTASGEEWKIQHKFNLSKLTELGMGKDELGHKISELFENVVEYVQNANGQEADFYEIFTNFTSNVISMILWSKNYAYNDPIYIQLRDDVREFFMCSPGIDANMSGYLFHFWYRMKGDYYKRITAVRKRVLDFYTPIVKKRIEMRQSHSHNKHYSDLLDFFVQKITDNAENYDIENISSTCYLYFAAGTETVASTLYHGINLMILHTKIQEKVQHEIDSVFDSERPVSYQDRHLLPYTQAVIQEVQRYVCLLPFTVARSNSKKLTVGQYTIPEKSNFILNAWTLSRDKREFKNPDNFDPNNFLNENGEFVKNDANLPFSVGRRICIGASLASMELFIGFVTLMQKFTWNAPKGKTVDRVILECQSRVLVNFKCVANNRC